jgi:NADP-dependent 3-hydroxy acid dehydrogenase YdfG
MSGPGHIMITGASSGIGAALARRYARPGAVLRLGGRDAGRLDAVAAECRARGADPRIAAVDVRDRAAMAAWIAEADHEAPIDLVIANAGISGGTGGVQGDGGRGEARAQFDAICDVNMAGVANTAMPALRAMAARGRGQVALMSSLASFRGFPGAPAYCASKAMVRIWGEALRPDYAPLGVRINVICPGYVRSPMTDANDFPMPFLIEADAAASIIADGLARNVARIVFPRRLYWLLRCVAALPEPVLDRVMARLPRKAVARDA